MSDHGPSPHENQPHFNPSPSSLNVESTSLSSSSPVENYDVSKWEGKKKMKRNDKKNKIKKKVTSLTFDHHVGNQSSTSNSVESIDFRTRTPRKTKFPCRLCKGEHILKYFHGLSWVL